jgi:hypothetical protein
MSIHATRAAGAVGRNHIPRERWRGRVVLLCLGALGAGLVLVQLLRSPPEPVYAGRTLTEWLQVHRPDPSTFWQPNDFYGHIHDELWDKLVAIMEPSNELSTAGPAESSIVPSASEPPAAEEVWAVRQIGTNAIPKLIQLMASKATAGQKIRLAIAEWRWLPTKASQYLYPYAIRHTAQSRQIAAYDGFAILGTNAAPALPALSNLLFGTAVDLPLTLAIADFGPEGLALLTNALACQPPSWRNNAALALGLYGTAAKSAVPALLDCIERGDAGYDVLGALGRIGCDDPRLVKALIRLLQQRGSQTNTNLQEDMAFILLGLQREKAREAAPLVMAEYRRVANDPNALAYRRFYRRIVKAIAPDLEQLLPPPSSPDEESGDWP